MSVTLPLIVLDIIGSALRQIGSDPSLPLQPQDAPVVAKEVGARIEKEARFRELTAEVEHLTNQEPWYRSRVTWGALITLAASVGSGFGVVLGPEEIEAAVTVLTAGATLIGGVVTLYGRWIAKRPIAY